MKEDNPLKCTWQQNDCSNSCSEEVEGGSTNYSRQAQNRTRAEEQGRRTRAKQNTNCNSGLVTTATRVMLQTTVAALPKAIIATQHDTVHQQKDSAVESESSHKLLASQYEQAKESIRVDTMWQCCCTLQILAMQSSGFKPTAAEAI